MATKKNPLAAQPAPIEINFDPERLTIGQIEQLEEVTQTPLSEIVRQMQAQQYTAKILKAIVWLLVSADDPTFTIEDAGNVRLASIMGATPVPPSPAPDATETASVRARS